MKKLFLAFTMLLASTLCFAQCPSTNHGGVVAGLNSTTHPFQTGGVFDWTKVFLSTVPVNTGTQYMGQGMNNYRVTLDSGYHANNFNWTQGGNAVYKVHLYKSSNGLPSTITTNLGTLSTNGTVSTNFITKVGTSGSNLLITYPNPY